MPAKSLFDHLTAIYQDQRPEYFDELSEADQKSLNPYMINKFISMNMDFVPIVNEFQKYYAGVGPRETYLFYSQIIPKGKYFNKFIKKQGVTEYEEWLVALVARYFTVSLRDATDYLQLFYQTAEGKKDLRSICEFYGTDPKTIQKVKL